MLLIRFDLVQYNLNALKPAILKALKNPVERATHLLQIFGHSLDEGALENDLLQKTFELRELIEELHESTDRELCAHHMDKLQKDFKVASLIVCVFI